jgi:hypothetical protein
MTNRVTRDQWELWQTLVCGAVSWRLLNKRGRRAAKQLQRQGFATRDGEWARMIPGKVVIR